MPHVADRHVRSGSLVLTFVDREEEEIASKDDEAEESPVFIRRRPQPLNAEPQPQPVRNYVPGWKSGIFPAAA